MLEKTLLDKPLRLMSVTWGVYLLVIPYGTRSFFEYLGITLFSLCTIGCINLLFRHAYSKKSESAIKKDLSHIYSALGITGKADLKALFIGYQF